MVSFGDSHPYVNGEYIEQLEGWLKEFKTLEKDPAVSYSLNIVYTGRFDPKKAKRHEYLKGKLLQGLYSCYMEVHDGSCCPEYRPVFVEILKTVNKTW